MTRTSLRGRRRAQRSSSTSRCSTITNAVTPRWGTCPRRSTSNHAPLNSVSTFRGELQVHPAIAVGRSPIPPLYVGEKLLDTLRPAAEFQAVFEVTREKH